MRTLSVARCALLVRQRRATVVLAVTLLAAAGCSNAKPDGAAASRTPTSTQASQPTTALTGGLAVASATPSSAGSSHSAAPATSISIPPNLCAATDIAQNTADAYMGALSAGNEKEAVACVFTGSVPLATTRSLLAHQAGTAVYLPKQGGADGPTAFDYTGAGKSIRVTVRRLADHHTWVTGVAVSRA